MGNLRARESARANPWPRLLAGRASLGCEEGSVWEPQSAKLLQGGAISFSAGCYLVE